MTLLRKLAAILAACLITSPAWGQTIATPGAGLSTNNTFTGTNIFTSPIQSYIASDTTATVIGSGAGAADTSSSSGAIIIGTNAEVASTTPTQDTVIGVGANRYRGASGAGNVVLGYNAGLGGTSGTNSSGGANVIIGVNAAGSANDSNFRQSVAIGYGAATSVTTSGADVLIGDATGLGITSGLAETVIGAYAGQGALGSNNTIIGEGAGGSNVTGASNTLVGYAVASSTLTTGTGNVLIGTSSSTTTVAAGTTNEINIDQGYINFATAPTITTGQALGTTPTITANSSHVFKAVVGATPTGTTETIGLPTAPNGWFCTAWDITTSANTAKQTASSATGATMTWSGTLTASDVILHNCDAY